MRQPAAVSYRDFEDLRENQRVVIVVRWGLLAVWLFMIDFREPWTQTLAFVNSIGAGIVAFNAYQTYRILRGRPIPTRLAVMASVFDLTAITVGIVITNRFENRYYLMYYPAVMGLALTYPRPLVAFGIGSVAAGAYAIASITMPPGLDIENRGERLLLLRIVVMYGIIAGSVLMAQIERDKRRAAVEDAVAEAARVAELQNKVEAAELAAQNERVRLAREVHDGVAQSMYALMLGLESASSAPPSEGDPELREKVGRLVPLAQQALLETRNYMFDLRPMVEGARSFEELTSRQLKEFQDISGIPATLRVDGDVGKLPTDSIVQCYRTLREALSNVLKHARASRVWVTVSGTPTGVILEVRDDGRGFHAGGVRAGYGLGNIRERATAAGGTSEITSVPGKGTTVRVTFPAARRG